jgi:hypothetical protein
MSTLATIPIASNTANTGYTADWASLYDAAIAGTGFGTGIATPQVWQEIINYYGPGVGLLEWQYAAGAITNIKGPTETLFEQGSLVKLVEVGVHAIAAIPAALGSSGPMHLAATEFNANGDCYLSLNDTVIIPAKYCTIAGVMCTTPQPFQVIADDGGVGILRTFTIRALNVLVALAVVVPVGTLLMVTGGNYANGVASGRPKSAGWYARHFDCSTKKSDWTMTGSIQSNQRYYETLRGGGTGVFTKATMEADFLLSKYINDDILLGVGVSNTLTQVDRLGLARQATGTVGLLEHFRAGAMKQYYTLAYGYTDFDDVKDLLNSQGVANRDVTFFHGSLLGKQLENAGLDFLKEFSGGTDLMRTLNSVGIAFKAVQKNGINFVFKEIPSFSDPTAYGAASFEDYFTGLGFIVPNVDVTVRGSADSPESFKLKNFVLAFKSYAGENRTRINKVLQGVATLGTATSPFARDTFDDCAGTMLSEYAVIVLQRNQMILVQNDILI